MTLFEHTQRRKEDELRFLAIIHGATFKDEEKEEKEDLFKFKDPKEYDHLSKEERKELTKKMKLKHQVWTSQKNVAKGE
jgi:hypothetical protein